MGDSSWPELLGYALAIGFSPLHLALLLLLLLGPRPLRRASCLVVSWLLMSALVIGLLLGVGHGLLLSMEKGTSHRTGLDLLATGAFLALGVETLRRPQPGLAEVPEWSHQLDRLLAMPIPLLMLVSAALQVAGPEDLFLYAKAAGALFQPDWNRWQDGLWTLGFSALTSLLLLVPLVACALVGKERLQPTLGAMKGWLDRYGQRLMGGVCLFLALVVGWQGVEGLHSGQLSGGLG
ncbi:MAG: GAP family protein [Cyanobacteriota bacterium]|jgi:hypothetical protein